MGVPFAIHVYLGCCENSKELRDRSSELPKELHILVTATGIVIWQIVVKRRQAYET